jgi:hypothetical protein
MNRIVRIGNQADKATIHALDGKVPVGKTYNDRKFESEDLKEL